MTSAAGFVGGDREGLPVSLPLLEFLIDTYQLETRRPLANTVFLGVQHLTGVFVPLLHSLMRAGLAAERTFLVGKAYSTAPAVAEYLRDHGASLAAQAEMTEPRRSYEHEAAEQIIEQLAQVVKTLNRHPECRALLFDEGGTSIRALHERFPGHVERFHCVEQTTRGTNAISDLELRCPVVNVARSKAKAEVEAPMIASSMVRGFHRNLADYSSLSLTWDRQVLVLGYGVVGRHLVSELLRHDYQVKVYDPFATHRPDVYGQGALRGPAAARVADLRQELGRARVVMGCTGRQGLNEAHLRMLPTGALLVNCASSDIEFPVWADRVDAAIVHSREPGPGKHLRPWTNLYRVVRGPRHFYVANGGFPINFTGELDPIPPSEFQLTRALMLAAGLQALASREPGLLPLDSDVQRDLCDTFATLTDRMDQAQ